MQHRSQRKSSRLFLLGSLFVSLPPLFWLLAVILAAPFDKLMGLPDSKVGVAGLSGMLGGWGASMNRFVATHNFAFLYVLVMVLYLILGPILPLVLSLRRASPSTMLGRTVALLALASLCAGLFGCWMLAWTVGDGWLSPGAYQ